MNVLVFNSSMRVGGAESMSIALANALAARGVNTAFAAADGPLHASLEERVAWMSVMDPNRYPLHAARRLRRYIRAFRPHVIHSHGATCSVVASWATQGLDPRPVRVLTHHSRVFRRTPAVAGAWIMRRSADHFVAISRDKRRALEGSGIDATRITDIPNFVDVDGIAAVVDGTDRASERARLEVDPGAFVVLLAGRMIPGKGFDRFVRILARTARALDVAVVGIAAGDGPAAGEIRAMVDRGEAGDAIIRLPGFVSDVRPLLAVADAVLFPSSLEVLPMFLIETAAAGRAAVVSDIPGNRDVVVHGETGLRVGGDDDAFAEALAGLARDDALRERLARAARERARAQFDRGRVVDDVIALYRRLVPEPV